MAETFSIYIIIINMASKFIGEINYYIIKCTFCPINNALMYHRTRIIHLEKMLPFSAENPCLILCKN